MLSVIRAAKRLANYQLQIAGLAVLAILLTISADVLLRATTGSPWDATLEVVSYYYMIPLVFLPLMQLEMDNEHISTDLFYQFFPNGLKQASILISGLLVTGIYALLTYVSFGQAVASTQNQEVAMGVNLLPIWPVRWVLPIVFATTLIASALSTFGRMLNRQDVSALLNTHFAADPSIPCAFEAEANQQGNEK